MDFRRSVKSAAFLAALFVGFAAFRVEAQSIGGACPTAGWVSLGAGTGNPGYILYCNGSTWALAEAITSGGLIGIGTTTPQSALDVSGGVAVGSYAGSIAAPSNSLIVSGTVAIGTSNQTAGTALDLGSNTNSLLLPVGTTGQRPTGVNGMIRYNSTATAAVEAYINGAWASLLTSGAITINLGTSASATNPQRSGDATTGFYSAATNTVAVALGGIEAMQWNTIASGVDYVSITPGLSGTAPKIAAAGATATQHINLAPKGAAGVVQFSGNTMFWQDNTNQNVIVGNTAAPSTISQAGGGSNGQGDVAVGYQALNGNTTGYWNTAMGYLAGVSITTGTGNTLIGYEADRLMTTANNNTAVGQQALYSNTGSNSTAMGASALENATTGVNSAFGYAALFHTTTGTANTAFGNAALNANTTGTNNTVFGYGVASTTLATGQYNILIGTGSAVDTTAAGTNYNLNIGNLLQGDMTSSTALGTEALFLQSTASSVDYLQIAGGATGNPGVVTASGQGTDANVSISVAPKGTGKVSIAATTAAAALDISANTTSLLLPVGTTGQRPTAANGMIRYNSTTPAVEAYVNGAWTALGGSAITLNLGTSASVTNPQRSGDATTGFYSAATNTVAVALGGIEAMQWNTVASGVDYLSITPGLSGTAPQIAAAGATATQHINLAPKGAAGVIQFNGIQVLWRDNTNRNLVLGNTAMPTTVSQAGGGLNGQGNVALGSLALNANTTGQFNVAIGSSALAANTIGAFNMALASSALAANTTGNDNTAIGTNALTSNTTGSDSTAIGLRALSSATTGTNTGIGVYAGRFISTGTANTAVGTYSMEGITGTKLTGNNNTALGDSALYTIQEATNSDTAVGYYALKANTTGAGNTAVGASALAVNTTGANNTSLGYQALSVNTTGTNNTVLGYNVASTTLATGSGNILIGYNSAVDTTAAGTNYNLNIGNLLQGDMTSSTALGTEALFLQSTASSVDYLQIAGGATGNPGAVTISGQGTDTNVTININPKGTGNIIAGISTGASVLDLSASTSSMILPSGTVGQRPTAANGMLRYNSSTPAVEAYYNAQWNTLASASNTITLGTSASVTNPQRSGDVTTGFYSAATNTVAVALGGIEAMQWNTIASGVDYLSITPGLSGTAPKIAAAGATATQHINLAPKGAAGVVQFSGGTMF